MATLYDTLGVHAHATEDEIKRAYRKAAMKWHPDRNHGAEEMARANFQEIRDAYAILSDAAQRAVYDAVYAEQMRSWEDQQARREAARAEREASARAADEAAYAEMVALAMRFADEGHNRDVLFGVLLGRQYDARRASQIADSIAALQAARREAAANAARQAPVDADEHAATADATAGDEGAATRSHAASSKDDAARDSGRGRCATDNCHEVHGGAQPAGSLGGLWFQFLNSLRF
ncbi:J domain-containing protein [Paraburkholderia sp. PREW-6R]|uniref:J domain-containing protein n=1 Tax=Paraburkholderia sp. PREW-6R TaxID=3141544 RepID=UPI0031F59072